MQLVVRRWPAGISFNLASSGYGFEVACAVVCHFGFGSCPPSFHSVVFLVVWSTRHPCLDSGSLDAVTRSFLHGKRQTVKGPGRSLVQEATIEDNVREVGRFLPPECPSRRLHSEPQEEDEKSLSRARTHSGIR